MNKQEHRNTGEGLAYTAKGLFKTADILKIEYKLLLSVSILFSIFSLTFEIQAIWLKCLGVMSVFASIWILINENSHHKVSQYMELANEYLALYFEVEKLYLNDLAISEEIHKKRTILNSKTNNLAITWLAKKWVDKSIENEMNLQWLQEKD
ncbi:hypothetical protein KJ870_00675 [bacterium]|nr:hypothetical protein [bacterium]MBU1433444.1 hypothetical protein [bacterium]MBU1503374.1 hypothetical protein [bacterium]